MTLQTTPFALQSASHPAALFRQSAGMSFVQGGVIAAGELAVTQNSTPAMSVFIGAGRAKVTGTSATAPSGFTWTTQGMYDVLNDATFTQTISASTGLPRIDVLYIGVNDAFYTGATNSATFAIALGTAAASPIVPSIPVNAMALAQITVRASTATILNSDILDVRSYATFAGQSKVYATKALLLAVTSLKANDIAVVTSDSTATNNGFFFYTGSVWSQLTSTSFDASAIVSGTLALARLPLVTPAFGGTGAATLTGYVLGNGSATMTASSTIPASALSGQTSIVNGGTGVSAMSAGLLKYNGSALVSGQTITAATDIPASEQANIVAGKFYAGGTTAGAATRIFVQSATPTGMVTGDLWFY